MGADRTAADARHHVTERVTIAVPTFDEEAWIAGCLDSLLAQDYPGIDAILVVDGRSNDSTRAIVERIAAEHPTVRLLDNPNRSAAAALNVALAATRTDVFVRADAHTTYAPDYVRRCVEVLTETGADDVGGPMVPDAKTRFGRAVAAVTTSRIGIGSGAFHWTTSRRDVDTVYLGTYRAELLRRLGGWDESGLQWAAEDHELNFRITASGGRIVCDPSIRSWYRPRETPRALWRQYFNYGVGKVSTLAKHHRLPTWRPLAPASFVAASGAGVGLALLTRRPVFLAPVAAWCAVAGVASAGMARRNDAAPADCVAALAICHTAYGIGFWTGCARLAAGMPFTSSPASR
jgi:cellulose synthase/poly-beta-1,6-N-acetylglucosamine synthase-like glycosyltransferase